jgi:hypothetical protein
MGDGASLAGNNVLQRYEHPGTYTISVVARNSLSADTLTTLVEVQPRPGQAPEPEEVVAEQQSQDESAAASRRVWYRPGELRGMKPVSRSEGGYGWVVGSYLESRTAEQLMRQFRVKGFRTAVIADSRPGASTAYRVVVGQFASTGRALSAKREIQRLIATPITLLDIANPSVAVGGRVVPDQEAPRRESRQRADEAGVPVDRTTVESPPREPAVPVRSALPVEVDAADWPQTPEPRERDAPEEPDVQETPEAPEAPEAPETPEAGDLRSDVTGPEIKSLKVYLRDERLLLFLDGVSDPGHGIRRVEYRVFSDSGDQLSNWSEVSLVPPGRSSYGLQLHRVPVPGGLETAGGRVEVRAVNAAGGFSILSATIGAE